MATPWTGPELNRLRALRCVDGLAFGAISAVMSRSPVAIERQSRRLRLRLPSASYSRAMARSWYPKGGRRGVD